MGSNISEGSSDDSKGTKSSGNDNHSVLNNIMKFFYFFAMNIMKRIFGYTPFSAPEIKEDAGVNDIMKSKDSLEDTPFSLNQYLRTYDEDSPAPPPRRRGRPRFGDTPPFSH
ncbi:hypothetical protein TSUD_262910 [Trifolium subterraneum]|nr:hypothetical protein TSUD_262910 [Trifolium subterraneum]